MVPELSVCIPTHHGRCDLLRTALDSVAAALLPDGFPVEVVVSDNASHDGTEAMVRTFAASHPELPVVYARNECDIRLGNILRVVERARGTWCWLFGSDDRMTADGLAVIAAAVRQHPDVSGFAMLRANFDAELKERVEGDADDWAPARRVTRFDDRTGIHSSLGMAQATLSTNVVHRQRWLAAAARVGNTAVQDHRDWPHLVVIGEMTRHHPSFVFVPAMLVCSRSYQPYLAEERGPNFSSFHASLVRDYHRMWRFTAGTDRVAYRKGIERLYATFASPYVIHNLKIAPQHSLRWDVALLRSFTPTFWRVPRFWRDALPLLLQPGPLYRTRVMRSRSRGGAMPVLHPSEARSRVTFQPPERWLSREMLRLPVRVRNLGNEPLRSVGDHPVHVAARWFSSDGAFLEAGARAILPGPVRPGEEADVTCFVHIPWEPGHYILRIAPVQELVCWFDDADPANGIELVARVESAVAELVSPGSFR